MIKTIYSDEIPIRCWCFDCTKVFFTDGNAQAGSTFCPYCRKKNYDFDINFKYSKQGKRKKKKRK